ncbi:hypothetical protein V1517DRAFT_359596 [Lipomyces orientalis]|uniref:Uncharacterized protein n=1 Tax=Lipomyces orientalis TaxID=1233043 RepID=A0ACC3TSS3_9ASCO
MDWSKLPSDWMTKLQQFTKTLHHELYPSVDPTNPKLSLVGKVVIITGASRGIGADGFAMSFARSGVKGLVLVARDAVQLQKTVSKVHAINPAIEVLAVPANVADEKDVAKVYAACKEKFVHADILVNNAGINRFFRAAPGQVKPEDWWMEFEVNGKGSFLMMHGLVNSLPTPDTPVTVINVISGAAWSPAMPFGSSYSISKLVVLQEAAYFSASYKNMKAFAVHPGLVRTDMTHNAMLHMDSQPPELVGGLGVWLSHPHAGFLNGRVVANTWDVDELVARNEEILGGKQLTIGLIGTFGPEQFE